MNDVPGGLMWSTAMAFMNSRADLSEEKGLLVEANDRRGTAVALGMSDLSESIAVMQSQGLSDAEIAATLRVAAEYFADPDRPPNRPDTVPGGFS